MGTYVYDGQGRRVKKVAGGQTTYFLYDQQSRLIAESNGSGDVVTEYLYLPDRPLVKVDIDGSSELAYYYHTDHLGTPLFLTDSAGQKVWSAELLPFGEGYDINEDVDGDQVHVVNNLRFPGQYYDAETGLHYNVMRDYNPLVGRYTQSDPIGLMGGINTFVYVGSSPMNWIDPYGLELTLAQQEVIVAAAKDWSNSKVPYVYGGSTKKGADCSGAVSGIYKQADIDIGRLTTQGFKSSPLFILVTGAPQIGDVGVYPGHVVLYGGNAGKNMDVWSASHTGGPVFGPANSYWYGKPTWYRYNGK